MQSLREVIAEYKQRGRAIGHFNFSDSNQLRAIAGAAMETKLPALAALSEGEREFFPLAHARALIDQYQREGAELYFSADHTYSVEKAKAAIDAGVDAIVVDGAKLPFAQNAALLKEVVAYAKHKSGFFSMQRHTLVEGELGYIGSGSSVLEAVPEGAAVTEAMMTKPEELSHLIAMTGIDLAAPAVGNVHGIVLSGQPKLSLERIAALAKAAPVPLVLHGGSGSGDEEFRAAAKAGMAIIHINTELRLLYRDTLRHTLETTPETTPYKFLKPAVDEMQQYLAQKMRLFAGL